MKMWKSLDYVRWLMLPLFFLFVLSAQGTILPRICPSPIAPDLFIAMSIGTGILLGPVWGALMGLFLGLVQGSTGGGMLEAFMISRAVCGMLGGWLASHLFRGRIFRAVICGGVVTVLGEGVFSIVSLLHQTNLGARSEWVQYVGAEALYNCVCVPVILVFVKIVSPSCLNHLVSE